MPQDFPLQSSALRLRTQRPVTLSATSRILSLDSGPRIADRTDYSENGNCEFSIPLEGVAIVLHILIKCPV